MAEPAVPAAAFSPERSTVPRLGPFRAVGLVLGGVGFAFIGGFLQALTWTAGSVTLPVGLVVVFAALLAFVRALVHRYDRRMAGVWFAAGWLFASIALAVPWPGGDIVLGDNTTAKVYLFGGAVLVAMAANLPARLRPERVAAAPIRSEP